MALRPRKVVMKLKRLLNKNRSASTQPTGTKAESR
jgi:hypothetical protein